MEYTWTVHEQINVYAEAQVGYILKAADPKEKSSVNLKELMDGKSSLLAGIGCRTNGPDENGNWNCDGLLNGVEISGDGIITKKSLLDHHCKTLCKAFKKSVCQILD